MRKAFLERTVVELVYKLSRGLPQVFEKVSLPLKCHSNFWGGGGHIHTHTHYIHVYIYINAGADLEGARGVSFKPPFSS